MGDACCWYLLHIQGSVQMYVILVHAPLGLPSVNYSTNVPGTHRPDLEVCRIGEVALSRATASGALFPRPRSDPLLSIHRLASGSARPFAVDVPAPGNALPSGDGLT